MRWNLQATRTFRFLLRIIAFRDILRRKPRWNWKRRFLHKKAACIPAVFPSLMKLKKKKPRIYRTSSLKSRAIDGARTRGLDLGKVARYQLRHYRIYVKDAESHPKRVMGIEPTYPAWKAGVLPLNYTRRHQVILQPVLPTFRLECPEPESNQ